MISTTRTTSTEPDAPRTIEEQGGEALTSPQTVATPAAPALDLPPAWTPNQVERRLDPSKPTSFDREMVWTAPAGDDRFAFTSTNGHTTFVRLYAGEAKGSGFGETARAAYREAYRELRLDGYFTADLLKERAGLQRQLDAALDKIALEAARSTETRRELEALKGRLVELQALRRDKPARDPGTAVLTLAYLRAWLTNAPLGEIQREGLEVLLALAQPWHARGLAWQRLLASVQRMGVQVGITPEEASRGR